MGAEPRTDFLVMGAGVAGLRAAVELADYGDVLVVTKESVAESNTHYAQGGIAVATEGDQDVALHLEDTISAGDGLVFRPAAEALVSEGPLRVAELIRWGAHFDREGNSEAGELLRTREAAHSHPRILHANGDATGAEISRSLVAYARSHPRIRFAEWTMLTGLVVKDGRVVAADLLDKENRPERVAARAVLIAAGGAGQVYSDTTNPAVATGDGIALAAEAGAELADMEFYQFHPTALSIKGAPRFCFPRRCAAREPICATTAASGSWSATTGCWNWRRAMWWPGRLPAKGLPKIWAHLSDLRRARPGKSISICSISKTSILASAFPASAHFWRATGWNWDAI
jgi:L-aspartate oxidase